MKAVNNQEQTDRYLGKATQGAAQCPGDRRAQQTLELFSGTADSLSRLVWVLSSPKFSRFFFRSSFFSQELELDHG